MKKIIKLNNKTYEIEGLFTIGSGIITISTDVIKFISENIPQIGIITTKSIGLSPREGNPEPVLCQFNQGLYYRNAVGLSNPGIDKWIEEVKDIYPLKKGKFLLTSIFAQTPEEFGILAQKLIGYTDGIELNLSCPHAKGYGMEIGSDPTTVTNIIKHIKSITDLPLFAKLSPNITNLSEIAEVCTSAGADAIVAINTVGPKQTIEEHSGKIILSNKVGGESGVAIRDRALNCIKMIKKCTNLPIIGMGGACNSNDIRDFMNVGADFIGIGTALVGMSTNELINYFAEIENDLNDNLNKSAKLLHNDFLMQYSPYTIFKNTFYGNDLFILEFMETIESKVGQFVFTWIPDHKEKPFSILSNNPLKLLVRVRGEHTKKLSELSSGEVLMIRGAYGIGFPEPDKTPTFLIGGGTGLAPLYHYSKEYPNDFERLYIGASKEKDISWITNLKNNNKAIVCIDKPGNPGQVIRKLEEDLPEILNKYEGQIRFFTCGPDLMMQNVQNVLSKYKSKIKLYSSLEKYMKCGVGLCGSCSDGKGLRTCVDGPIIEQIY